MGLAPFRDAALDRWHRKALLAAGGGATRVGLRALDQAISAQVRRGGGPWHALAALHVCVRGRRGRGVLLAARQERPMAPTGFAEHAALAATPGASPIVTSHLIPWRARPATRGALRGQGRAVMLAW